MSDLQKLTNELMQNPEFKSEYEALQPEMDIIRAILDARIHAGMTRLELSENVTGADVSDNSIVEPWKHDIEAGKL